MELAQHHVIIIERTKRNAIIERTKRTIEEALSKYLVENHNDWAKYLMMAYRSSIQAVTKYSPYYLIFGRPCSLPLCCTYETSQTKVFATPSDYVRNPKKEIQTSHELVLDTKTSKKNVKRPSDRKQSGP